MGEPDFAEYDFNEADALAQSKYNQAANLCGIAKGQNRRTENTITWLLLQARDVLLLKNRGAEQSLEEYGFSVVLSQTGSRKNILVGFLLKIPLPCCNLPPRWLKNTPRWVLPARLRVMWT